MRMYIETKNRWNGQRKKHQQNAVCPSALPSRSSRLRCKAKNYMAVYKTNRHSCAIYVIKAATFLVACAGGVALGFLLTFRRLFFLLP